MVMELSCCAFSYASLGAKEERMVHIRVLADYDPWEDIERLVASKDWGELYSLLQSYQRRMPRQVFESWEETIRSMLPDDVYLDDWWPRVKPIPDLHPSMEQYLVGEDIAGRWVHVLPDKMRDGEEIVLDGVYETLSVKGDISVSDFEHGNWAWWAQDSLAMVFDGVVSRLYDHDVYSHVLPGGKRISHPGDAADLPIARTPRMEGFLDPRNAELVALLVACDMDPAGKTFVEGIANQLGVELWESP